MSDEFAETLDEHSGAQPHAPVKQTVLEMSATDFEAFTFKINAASPPVAILGVDPARTRALVSASAAGVYLGKQSVLASYDVAQLIPQGFAVPLVAGPMEVKTTDEIYVNYQPNPVVTTDVFVYVWVERSVVKDN